MSADSSPASQSNRAVRAASRLTDQPESMTRPAEGRQEQKRQQDATRRQARDDRDQRGKSREVDQISALFSNDPGAPKSGDNGSAARKPASPEDAGRGSTPLDPSPRPALELDEDERDQDEGPKRKAKSKTVVEFATEHELEAKAIYDLAVPLEAGDEPVTVAQLKDHYKETRDFEQKRDDFEDWHVNAQNEVITARQQIDDVLQRVTSVIPPEVLARAFTDMQLDTEKQLEKARGQLREWFPEWADVQVKTRDRERLEQVLTSYGFSKFEVGAVRDARLIKFAMDAIRKADRYDRLKAAGTREKQPSKEPASNRKPRQPNATDQAREIAKTDPIGGVVKLLGG